MLLCLSTRTLPVSYVTFTHRIPMEALFCLVSVNLVVVVCFACPVLPSRVSLVLRPPSRRFSRFRSAGPEAARAGTRAQAVAWPCPCQGRTTWMQHQRACRRGKHSITTDSCSQQPLSAHRSLIGHIETSSNPEPQTADSRNVLFRQWRRRVLMLVVGFRLICCLPRSVREEVVCSSAPE
jgi:hypothetical protein